jgi:DNA-binding MarR family transcriptional regulator
MSGETRSSVGEAATELILATFRANGRLLEAGDRVGASHGLTSARWQVLGAVALANQPLTVPQIARRMGLSRQSVHASVERLVGDGMLELVANPEHLRSQLVRLTDAGRTTYAAVDRDRAAWVSELARGIPRADLETARAVLERLVDRLDADRADGSRDRRAPQPVGRRQP